MPNQFTRRRFVGIVSIVGPAAQAAVSAEGQSAPTASVTGDWLPRQNPSLVREIVTVSHFNPARVRELVERQPALARASIDWGFGDWESALGAAGHMGRRDIAELLLAHGARPTIFSAAMMGQLDVVRAFVEAHPGIQRTQGPHGITLLAHARAGGAPAEPVVRYLQGVGDADVAPKPAPLAAADRDTVVGRYEFGPGPRDRFDIDVQNDQLGIQRPDTTRRFLVHAGDLVFFPAGVPSVRIAFARDGSRVVRLTIADPEVLVTAVRR